MDYPYSQPKLQELIFRSLIIGDATDYKPKAEATEYLKTYPWWSDTRVSFLNAWQRCTELVKDHLVNIASAVVQSYSDHCAAPKRSISYYVGPLHQLLSYEVDQLAYEVSNLEWLLDILIYKRVAEEFLVLWAEDDGLSKAYRKASATSYGHLLNVSRVTAMLFTGIGEGKISANRKTMRPLFRNWLEPQLFGLLMKIICSRAHQQCDLMEDVLSNHVILNLTVQQQRVVLLAWVDRFVIFSGKNDTSYPDLTRVFETWWRNEHHSSSS